MPLYEVIVGNVGLVYSGQDELSARKAYGAYVGMSNSGRGRAGHEDVALLVDGDILKEHNGRQRRNEE